MMMGAIVFVIIIIVALVFGQHDGPDNIGGDFC